MLTRFPVKRAPQGETVASAPTGYVCAPTFSRIPIIFRHAPRQNFFPLRRPSRILDIYRTGQ